MNGTKPAARIFVGIGSNVGDRAGTVRAAVDCLKRIPETTVVRLSSLYETDPAGGVPQGKYLNAVCEVHSRTLPAPFLKVLQAIEMSLGRNRAAEIRWGPRTLDLDILFWGDLVHAEPGLEIPHPRLHERAFVLVPLAQIAPDLVHPRLNRSMRDLVEEAGSAGVSLHA